jgi:hypothetical protein
MVNVYSKYSPVHRAWQRFTVILSLVLCYAVNLGNTENRNKRSPCAPSSYYFCQNEILYSEIVNGLLSKFFKYICIHCEAENLSALQLLATVNLCTSCSQTADRKAWSLKSEMKFHFCWGVKKVFF